MVRKTCKEKKKKPSGHRLIASSVSRSEASGWSPDEAAEYTGGINSLSDAITPVVTEIRRRLRLHALSSLVQRRHSRATAWKLITLSQRLVSVDLG